MENGHNNTTANEHDIKPIAHIRKVLERPKIAYLSELIQKWVSYTKEDYQGHGVVGIFRIRIHVLSQGVDEQEAQVYHVHSRTNQMEFKAILIPLECDQVLKVVALEHGDLVGVGA